MELVRYDLYYTGNKHTAGILAGLYDTGLYGKRNVGYDVWNTIDVFNYQLTVPNYSDLGTQNEAFFKPEGYAKFGEHLKELAAAIAEHCENWEARERREVLDARRRVLYEDEFQIILQKLEEEIL